MSSDEDQSKNDEEKTSKDNDKVGNNDPDRKDYEFCVKWTLEDELKSNKKLRREDIDSLKKFAISLPKVDDILVTGK